MDKRGPLASLPFELLLVVTEHCEKQDLAALSGVSKKYNSICRPIVFRNVDLSIHNRGHVLCTFRTKFGDISTQWSEPSDSLQCNNIPPNMQKRQEAFLCALIRDTSLAQHVENFSWTLLLLDSNQRPPLGNDPFATNNRNDLDPKSPFNKIWDVFSSLTKVQNLDLAWLSRDLATPLIHSIPPTLFPAATTVRLVGVMPYALAASILFTNPQSLLHLDFDNLHQSGIVGSIHKGVLPHRQNPQRWNSIAPFGNRSNYFNARGPMQNLLGALAGKCSSLQTLHLRKAGPRDQFEFSRRWRSKENDIYAEWAFFLTSVRPTLESLVFEQGERLLPRAYNAQPPVRPMDQLFGDVIFPVLVAAEAGQWPRMKEVVIRGVQQWNEGGGLGSMGTVLVDGRRKLKNAFGDGVEVAIERKARVADHLGVGYENGFDSDNAAIRT